MSTINSIPFRSTIFYRNDGTVAPIGTVFTISTNNLLHFSDNLSLNTLSASTLTSFSTITASTIRTAGANVAIGQNVSNPNRFVDIRSDIANSVYFDLHSSDSAVPDFSTRIQSLGGATTGTGALNMTASTMGLMASSGVGIGTTNPYSSLHVYGSSTGKIIGLISNANTALGSSACLQYGLWPLSGSSQTGTNSPSAEIRAIVLNAANGNTDLAFSVYTGSSIAPNYTLVERMRITAAGNLGIGGTSPMYKTQIVLASNSDPGTSNVFALTTADAGAQSQRLYMGLVDNGGTGTNSYSWISASRFGHGYNSLTFQPDGGNVGIGITNPFYPLSVQGHIQAFNTTNDIMGLFSPSYGNFLHIGSWNRQGNISKDIVMNYLGGNVGIGASTTFTGSRMNVVSAGTGTDASGWIAANFGGTGTNPRVVIGCINGIATVGAHSSNLSAWADINIGGNVGKVGIGTNTPQTPLHVVGSATINTTSTSWMTKGSGGISTSGGSTFTTVSIYAAGSIWAGDVIGCATVTSFSDQRIKKDIQPVNGIFDLIQKIEIVSYKHIDQRKKAVKYGVVAQQIQPFLPEVIDKTKNWIPVPFVLSTSHECHENQVTIIVDASSPELQIGRKIKLYVQYDTTETEYETELISITSTSITCKVWDVYHATDRVFVYGVELDDFLVVDKQQLGLLALAGVQELHKTISIHETTILSLQAQNTSLRARMDALEARLAT